MWAPPEGAFVRKQRWLETVLAVIMMNLSVLFSRWFRAKKHQEVAHSRDEVALLPSSA